MAGYIFGLDNMDSLKYCIENGIYSTNLRSPSNERWLTHHEGTFADYISMKPGDNVYFFIKRKVYGIGELVNLGYDCKYKNYPEALEPIAQPYDKIKDYMLINNAKENVNNRLICAFKPSPNFFENGIDMDDVLASNPKAFKMLRAFWKLSFIKVDDEENKALKDIILKRNENFINSDKDTFSFNESLHLSISSMINNSYKTSSKEILKYSFKNDCIKHEMAIEAGIVDIISSREESIFGNWDYISHQVIASPFKAIDYMDKMDVFGYRYIKGFDTISKYLLIEIKRDEAKIESIDQVMKYVDWINQEYAYGDYSMIEAFLVSYKFPSDVVKYRDKVCIRNYIKGRRPTISGTWRNIKLIEYRYNQKNGKLIFKEI